jgi:AraC-like DNA-binding protein
LQAPVAHLSLPFGRGNERVYCAARDAGYLSVSTLGNPEFILPDDIKIIPRRGVYLLDSIRSFRRRVQAPPDCKRQYWRQRTISAFSMGTVIVKSLKKNLSPLSLDFGKK